MATDVTRSFDSSLFGTPQGNTTSFIDFTGANTGVKTPGGGSYGGPTDLMGSLTGEQRDAYAAITNLFNTYGLGSLAPKIFEYIKNGFSADTISILLQDTPEYKQRFAGNEARKNKGLPVLSPAEYLSTEASYRQLMRQAGLPEGFYDQPSDFSDFIGKDVSPTELKQRVDIASQYTTLASPEAKRALSQMYGIDEGHITAYFLDPERSAASIQKQAAAAAIGAEALKRGLNISGNAEAYALAGVNAQQAAQAYGAIADQLPGYQAISRIYGVEVGQEQLEAALLGAPNAEAQKGAQNVTRLASWNRARAQGVSGAGQSGLARRTSGQV